MFGPKRLRSASIAASSRFFIAVVFVLQARTLACNAKILAWASEGDNIYRSNLSPVDITYIKIVLHIYSLLMFVLDLVITSPNKLTQFLFEFVRSFNRQLAF